MLLSWVIQFKPLPFELPAFQARALESVFLDWVGAVDGAYAAKLHDSQDKPFTVSDLRGRVVLSEAPVPGEERQPAEPAPSRLQPVFAPNQPLWWRVTTFSPRLSRLVAEQVRQRPPDRVFLENCGCSLSVDRHSFGQDPGHPWAGEQSYEELCRRLLLNRRPPPAQFTLRFSSPAAFHKDGLSLLFPMPEQVVGSWLRRWNAFSPVTFPVETRKYAAQSLAVSRYRLETAVVQDEEPQKGFRGDCTFRFLEEDPYWTRVIATLAAFSFYCGTGIKTARGMGQTRWINGMHRSDP